MSTLDEIEARAREATPGPWDVEKSEPFICYHIDRANYKFQCWKPSDEYYNHGARTDAEFIAAARSDVPLLCRALRIAAEEYDMAVPHLVNRQKLLERWLQEAQDDQSDV